MTDRFIYLDHAGSTPCRPEAIDAMMPCFERFFGNPANQASIHGLKSMEIVERARSLVAALIGTAPQNIIWTSGATEANNLALLGCFEKRKGDAGCLSGMHAIVSKAEHRSVLAVFSELRRRGALVSVLSPSKDGSVSVEDIENAIRPETILVSAMWGNNELGTLNPVQRIGRLCSKNGIIFHCDAAQATGADFIDFDANHIDILTLSGHKAGGPKGVGALAIRNLDKNLRVSQIMWGGGQERGLRPGTLNVPAIAGFGAACAKLTSCREAEVQFYRKLIQRLETGISDHVRGATVNAAESPRLPHITSILLPLPNGSDIIKHLDHLGVSSGSACSSFEAAQSHVLASIGIRAQSARNTLRFSVGWSTTFEEIEQAISEVVHVVNALRESQAG